MIIDQFRKRGISTRKTLAPGSTGRPSCKARPPHHNTLVWKPYDEPAVTKTFTFTCIYKNFNSALLRHSFHSNCIFIFEFASLASSANSNKHSLFHSLVSNTRDHGQSDQLRPPSLHGKSPEIYSFALTRHRHRRSIGWMPRFLARFSKERLLRCPF